MAMAVAAAANDWSELPREILGLILERLCLPDHIRLSCVCSSWWKLITKVKIQPPKPQFPWLMLPGDDNVSAKFFSPSENRTYRIPFPLPLIRRRICIGSSFGWLVTVDELCDMHLVNPITRAQIQLPSIATLPYVDAVPDARGRPKKLKFLVQNIGNIRPYKFPLKWMHAFFFKKAVLSSDPSGGKACTVMLIHGLSELAFCRVGDKTWTSLRKQEARGVADIISHDGRFYTIIGGGSLTVWYEEGGDFKNEIVYKGLSDNYAIYIEYLVASLGGQLMLVLRDRLDGKTLEIKVLTFDDKQDEWLELNDLRDNAVFIGSNHSVCIDVTMVSTPLRRNCVYFSDDNLERITAYRHDKRDIGIFDMTDQRVKPIDSLNSHLNWPPPIWISPTLN